MITLRLLALASLLAAAPAVAPPAARAASTPATKSGQVLPWIVNNYEDAVSLARARKVPLFVEAWEIGRAHV